MIKTGGQTSVFFQPIEFVFLGFTEFLGKILVGVF